jgi:hypothetical protein
MSRTVLGPTQPPIQWVLGSLSPGVKRPRHEADHSPSTSAGVKNAWSYTSTPPICLHGMVLSEAQGQLYLSLSPFYAITFIRHGKVIILYWEMFTRNCEFKAAWYSSRPSACCNSQKLVLHVYIKSYQTNLNHIRILMFFRRTRLFS